MRLSETVFLSFIALTLGRPLLHNDLHEVGRGVYLEAIQASFGTTEGVTDREAIREHPLLQRRGLRSFWRNHIRRPLRKFYFNAVGVDKTITLVHERDGQYVLLKNKAVLDYGCQSKGNSEGSTTLEQPYQSSGTEVANEADAICQEGAEHLDASAEETRKPDGQSSLDGSSNQFVDGVVNSIKHLCINGLTRINAAAAALQGTKGTPGAFTGLPGSLRYSTAVMP
ncbi:MAG: hypothetical protein M1816_007718 [Peltula sp. TS41687]|nr:MAG: hypothetical protein M1816_007718 [Peltula sp. TS41687]